MNREFNRDRSSLQDEFRESRPKSVVVPETIDPVLQLILQDCHDWLIEIDRTLDISGTSIHSILHEHLTVKKICSLWIPHNLSIAQKNQSIRVCHSRTIVYRWYDEFKRGRSSLQDEFRESRPTSVVVPETIDPVLQLILQDHHD